MVAPDKFVVALTNQLAAQKSFQLQNVTEMKSILMVYIQNKMGELVYFDDHTNIQIQCIVIHYDHGERSVVSQNLGIENIHHGSTKFRGLDHHKNP